MAEDRVDSSRYHIKPLSEENYFMWSNKMEIVLRGKGLWGIVTGDEAPPSAEANADAVDKYNRRRNVAVTNLLLTIEDSVSAAVISLRNPKEIWDILQKTNQQVSEASIDAYLAQYQNVRMAPDEKVMTYVNRLKHLENKLAEVGHNISKTEKRRTLLRGLREEFAVTAEVVRATEKDVSEAIAQLIVFEATMDESTTSNSDEQDAKAFAASKDSCEHCGRKGHAKPDCFHNPASKNYRKSGMFPKNGKKYGNNKSRKATGKSVYTTFVATCLRADRKNRPALKKKWYIDSGASSHMSNDKSMFSALNTNHSHPDVDVGDGKSVKVCGIGRIRGTTVVNGKQEKIELQKVLYIPTLMCNLISVSQTNHAGFTVVFDTDNKNRGHCQVINKKTNDSVLTALELESNGLFEAILNVNENHPVNNEQSLLSTSQRQKLWHGRLGHVSEGIMQKTIPLVNGIDLTKVKSFPNCESCIKGKSKRNPRKSASEASRMSTKPLDLVHVDIVGPIKHKTLAGAKYFIPLYDDSSALSLVRFLKTKDEASKAVKEMITELETFRKGKVKRLRVKRLRSDNEGALLSKNFQGWLKQKGIKHELTSSYSPESNGKAERLNRTLMDMARSMLMDLGKVSGHQNLWGEAINTANFLRNRMYTSASNDPTKTPYEIIMNKKPDLKFVRKFGSKSYVHVPKKKRRGKFDERATVGICVGFERGNSYRIYIPKQKKIIVSRDVSFNETGSSSEFSIEDHPHTITNEEGAYEIFTDDHDDDQEHETQETPDQMSDDNQDEDIIPESDEEDPNEDDIDVDNLTYDPGLRRSTRPSKPPVKFGAMLALQARMGNEDDSTPLTFDEAMSSSDKEEWKDAMKYEIKAIEKKKTWKLVPLPDGYKAVKNKWVYTTKKDTNQNISRHRARLVAKGFTQRRGIDYDEVFAPVAKYSTLRLILALATDEDLNLLQLDVKSAFLNGKLDEEIYMEQPEGFMIKDKKNFVYRLLKALYGLKQASRAWHRTIDAFLTSIGFKKSQSDASLYNLILDGERIYILVYVDDMLLAGIRMQHLKRIANLIAEKFEIRTEEHVTRFLGIIVEHDKEGGSTKIHSSPMIDQMLKTFSMTDCRSVSTPLPKGIILDSTMGPKTEQERMTMEGTPYLQLIGALLHLANTTRPDIAFAVGFMSRFMENPGSQHWNASKHVLKYLKSNRTSGITYSRSGHQDLHGYSDSDFAGDRDTSKSTSGFVFMFSGGAISWRSKKQTITAQSTVEAEYIALSYSIRELIWLPRMVRELKIKKPQTGITLYGDNQGSISLSRNEIAN